MNVLSRSFLLAGLLLLTASALPAQRFVSGGGGFSSGGGGYGYGGNGYGGYGWGGGWGGEIGGWGFDFSGLHHPEEHPPFGVGMAHGDPEFIPSTFMDYNKALELGKRILEEQSKPQPSLGEIARQLRLGRRNYVPPPAPVLVSPPDSKRFVPASPEGYLVLQDIDGRPILCRTSGSSCRNSA